MIGDAEVLKQLRRNINAAGAVGISDGLRIEQSLLEGFERTDIRLGRAGLHGHAGFGTHQIDAAIGQNFAVLDQIVERGAGENHDIHRLAAIDAHRNGIGRTAHRSAVRRDDLVVRLVLELRDELAISSGESAGGHHLDLLSERGAARNEEAQQRDGKISAAESHQFILRRAKCHDYFKPVRFWITKNSELPVREQLVRQVLLGILSEDLPAGHKLPSVRAVARRHQIHSNTVSAAYHDLLEQGWLELRRGSGLYVRPMASSADGPLDQLLTTLLQAARRQNYEPEEVLLRLEHMVHPVRYERIVIAEADLAMREILVEELTDALTVPVSALESGAEPAARALIVALPTRAAKVRRQLGPGVPCIALRVRSVRASIESQSKPPSDAVITIVSRSAEIRMWSRAMLIAVGLEPDALSEIDASDSGWRDRLARNALVVADVIAAGELPEACARRVFRVIADSSIVELKQFCGL